MHLTVAPPTTLRLTGPVRCRSRYCGSRCAPAGCGGTPGRRARGAGRCGGRALRCGQQGWRSLHLGLRQRRPAGLRAGRGRQPRRQLAAGCCWPGCGPGCVRVAAAAGGGARAGRGGRGAGAGARRRRPQPAAGCVQPALAAVRRLIRTRPATRRAPSPAAGQRPPLRPPDCRGLFAGGVRAASHAAALRERCGVRLWLEPLWPVLLLLPGWQRRRRGEPRGGRRREQRVRGQVARACGRVVLPPWRGNLLALPRRRAAAGRRQRPRRAGGNRAIRQSPGKAAAAGGCGPGVCWRLVVGTGN